MIRGIGPDYAMRMARQFGKEVFDIIEANPESCGRLRAPARL
jgi:exodeoxyribonuclease V alpha subunit